MRKNELKNAFINQGPDGLASASALETLVQLLITALAGVFPWTQWPVIGWLVSWFLTAALTKVFDLIKGWFGIDIIPQIVQGQLDAYNKAKVVFENLPENATDAQVQAAKQQFNKDFSALIHVRIYGV